MADRHRGLVLALLCLASALLSTGMGQAQAAISYEVYTAQAGDTPENIAARRGVSASELMALNRLDAGQPLMSGQSIAIPLAKSSAPPTPRPASLAAKTTIEPELAQIIVPSQITSEPGAGQVYYQAQAGTSVVATALDGSYCGLVMVDRSVGWVPRSNVQLTGQRLSPTFLDSLLRGGRPEVVQQAFRYLGTPYKLGGQLPASVDCSLLVQTAFASCGVRLPRTAAAQFDVGQPVDYTQLLPGDRLYFAQSSGRIGHTGIYISNGQFIHASSNLGAVAVDNLFSPTYWRKFAGARR